MSTDIINDNDIINKFRDIVAQRYEFDYLKRQFPDLPESLNEALIKEIKTYFLESIYPPAAKRKELEDAFAGLGSYVRSPKKIWGLLGNMSAALFKFGRQFPTALKAGMAGLSAFHGAKDFEAKMADQAIKDNISLPISDEAFEITMTHLAKKDIENFIKDVKDLFKIMTNTKLISKTILILDSVVETMKKKSHVYPQKEVDGILLGKDILVKGYELFSKHDEKVKQLMVDYIYKNEMQYADNIYKKYNA